MTIGLIATDDAFEYIRNAIANILVVESAKQVALATAWNVANPTEPQLDPTEWALDVYTERSNAFELYRDEANRDTQMVNVWYESSSTDSGKSTPTRQWTTTRINVDCIACAVTEETDTGQEPGDEAAFLRSQQIARIVRRILMHPDYKMLGLPSFVGTRMMSNRRSSSGNKEVAGNNIAGVQLQFEVNHLEFYDFADLSPSEAAIVKIYREDGGLVYAQMDYDWTE